MGCRTGTEVGKKILLATREGHTINHHPFDGLKTILTSESIRISISMSLLRCKAAIRYKYVYKNAYIRMPAMDIAGRLAYL